jgi:RNA polymerase sigma-70 factor (ECF subfamily)
VAENLQKDGPGVDAPEVERPGTDTQPKAGHDDAELLDAVVAGDAGAFALLYTNHARTVFAFCGRRSGDWAGAEDLSSVVFLEAWRTRHRAFLVQGSLRPWLLGIAAHVVSTGRRSTHRHRAALARWASSSLATETAVDDVAVDAVRRADLDRTGVLVRAAIDRLGRPQRQVVELCLLGELTPAEAAEVLAIPVTTVRSRLEDSRSRLRLLLRSSDLDRPSWLIGHHLDDGRDRATGPEGAR